MGLPQRPHRLLLSVLRGDRRQGRMRAQHGRRGAEGAGVGRRADLAEPHRPGSRCARLTCSAAGRAAGASSARPTPTCSATRSRVPRACRLPSPTIGREHRIKRFLFLYPHPRRTQPARWSVPCGIWAARSREGCSRTRRRLAWSEHSPVAGRDAWRYPVRPDPEHGGRVTCPRLAVTLSHRFWP
jgi:hypothetical protein